MRGRGIIGLILIVAVVAAVYVFFTAVNPVTRYIKEGLDLKGGVHVVLQATQPATLADMKKAETIIAYRANKFGISEPAIQIQGTNQIVVDLAGVHNQQQAIQMIGKTAQLIFKSPTGQVLMTGQDLKSASAQIDQNYGPIINLTFNATGTRLFAAATQKYLNQTIAMYLDKNLLEAPRVDAVISSGQAMIYPFSSLTQAQQMADLLNSGALPVPMRIIEAQTVSPFLGQDSVNRSAMAILIAMVLIVLIMVGIYRYAGLIADIALAIYLVLVIGALIAFGAVLTLPGIAGVILSAAIAVDANVIIFARIRDELRAGRTLGAAIDHGFKNALRAIMDSNVSTVIAAAVLYYFGTGEVRGFAVTLIIGVLASFVTAVAVTRYLLRLSEDTVLVRNQKLFLG